MSNTESHYTDSQKRIGRRWWIIFSIVNTFSFQFLAGNVIILFLINLDASKTVIGLVSSFLYASYLIMPIGRMLSQRVGIVKGFSIAWLLRYAAISPILAAPFLALSGVSYSVPILIVAFSYFGFQMVRGAGLVSFSPILTELTHGDDRGRYISVSRIFTDSTILLGTLLIAFFLGLIRVFDIRQQVVDPPSAFDRLVVHKSNLRCVLGLHLVSNVASEKLGYLLERVADFVHGLFRFT